MARKVRILLQTAHINGDKFDVNNCLGFSITNQGRNDASYGYEGSSQTFDINSGETKLYGFLPDNYEFDGQMEVRFKNDTKGKISVVIFKAITEEK